MKRLILLTLYLSSAVQMYAPQKERKEHSALIKAVASLYRVTESVVGLIVTHSTWASADTALMLAVAKVESDFRTDALSSVGARGLFQVRQIAADDVQETESLECDHVNTRVAIKFLYKQIKRFGSVKDALVYYNSGHRASPAAKRYAAKVLREKAKIDNIIKEIIDAEQTRREND